MRRALAVATLFLGCVGSLGCGADNTAEKPEQLDPMPAAGPQGVAAPGAAPPAAAPPK